MTLSSSAAGQLTSAAFKFDSFVRSGVDPRTGSYSCSVALDAAPDNATGGAKVSMTLSYDSFNDQNLGLGIGWSLRTCSYDQRRRKLTLTNGETYQLFMSGSQVAFQDKKLDNLRVTVQGDELVIEHIDGRAEILSRPSTAYNEWLLAREYCPDGKETRYEYCLLSGRRQLVAVYHQRRRVMHIDYAQNRPTPPTITVWPDIPAKRLQYLFTLESGVLERIRRVTAQNSASVWSFGYVRSHGYLVMNEVRQPNGAQERLTYLADGHKLPTGAPATYLPVVSQSVMSPGGGQPTITNVYEYSSSNFLGYGSGFRWSAERDVLYDVRRNYEYSSTQIQMVPGTSGGREASRIIRTYNRFHSMISQRTISGSMMHLREIEYYAEPNLAFSDQPPQFQMQRVVRDSFFDSRVAQRAGRSRTRSEVTRTSYDEHGNLLEKTSPCGAREVYEYFPAQESADCPASPIGVPCFLKQKAIIASPDFATAPTTVVRYTYTQLPSLRPGDGGCIRLASETLYEDGVSEPRVNCRLRYVNNSKDFFHGRLQSKVETVGGVRSEHRYAYQRENDNVRTDLTFSAQGLSHRRQEWHDECGWLIKICESGGSTVSMEYDSLGQLTRETVMPDTDSSASRQFTYRAATSSDRFVTVTVKDARGGLTATHSDGLGRTIRVEKQDVDEPGAPMRVIHEAQYDGLGRLQSDKHTDWFNGKPKTLESLYEYDQWGHQNRTIRRGQMTVHDEIDPVARTRTEWVEGGGKTRTFINALEKPSRVERVDLSGAVREVTAYEYDGLGRCIRQTASDGAVTCYTYDLAGRVLSTILPDGTVIGKSYAAQSQGDYPTQISANDYVVGSRTYDGLMRITGNQSGGRTERMVYEGSGRSASQKITPAGKVLRFTLDPLLGDCVTERSGSQASVLTRHRFDPNTGLLQESANSLVQRRLEYFASGRLSRESWVTALDRFDSLQTYSLMGKPIGHTDVNGTNRTCLYDETGRLSGITQGPIAVTYSYDSQGQVSCIAVTDSQTGISMVTDLAYDEFGREILRRSGSQGNDAIEVAQSFGPGDKLSRRTLKSNNEVLRLESFTYDLRGRLTRYTCEGKQAPVDTQGKVIVSQDYTYDYLDNICQVVTRFAGGENIANYRYDLTDKTQLSAVTHSHPDYVSANSTFNYDVDGNMLSDSQGRRLFYDELGRLENVTSTDSRSTLACYRYDASDRLHAFELMNEKPCRRFYREEQLCGEVTGDESRSVVREGQQLLALLQGPQTALLSTDAYGNVLQALSGGDNTRHAYSPYGHRPVSDGLVSLFGFSGQPLDPATGCYLLGNGYRAYDPVLMRFHRPDSWSPFDGGGLNPYAYCLGDPINLSDPTGHVSVWSWVKIGLTAAFAVASVALTIATLGASAPLVGMSFSAATALTLEVVSGAVSIASMVLEETAPDAVATQILSYASIALGVASGGASLAGKVLGKGTSVALRKTVDSLGDVVTVSRQNALRATRVGAHARAASPLIRGGGQRNLIALQSELRNVLTAKDVVGYVKYPVDGVKYTIDRDRYIEKAKGFFQQEDPWSSKDRSGQAFDDIYGDVRERGSDIRFA
ncbi:type IV secretion protein Rhs [Pseudomonas hefeiensis]|uniref:Type IV secretion protein Rhs n=1 Tax=Pseudomonas hefeiensis TaxID=2738125 RepID=A0ABY9GBU0_9PSED|nr:MULTISPECIES: RHS repeat-associated core domain-containing protein [unclassified Pseudomonas]WLH13027.1 type IV secretion protein Rhs [Pseudomonas sp. FP205]WLH96092.1 type IV secretion protein Rhs [Pseudomonas sp. FP53]WLI40364.1 type IV secretion protein Rhs [Pseudomonas sp. FP821]